jgi:undecaprenyl-diphosphatase
LVLVPWLFGWKDPGVVFDVALHLGTATAVILFFFKDWLKLISAGLRKPKTQDGKLFWLIVLATIPGALFGVLLDKYMENFRNAALIGVIIHTKFPRSQRCPSVSSTQQYYSGSTLCLQG